MNDLNIFCFITAARTRNFSITAKELVISPQAVSKHIKNLEDELGYQLFFRDITPLTLTKAGEYLLTYFSRRNQIKSTLINKYVVSDSARRFTIACSQWIGSPSCFSNVARAFHELYPDVDLHLLNLDAKEILSALSDHSIDFLLTSSYMAKHLPRLWKYAPLTEQPLYLIHSKNVPADINQLHLYPFYAPSAGENNDHATCIRVRNTCANLGFNPQNIIICPNMGSVIFNVLLNNGVTLGSYREDTQEYSYIKTDQKVDIVTYMPYHTSSPFTECFRALLDSFCSRQKGADFNE